MGREKKKKKRTSSFIQSSNALSQSEQTFVDESALFEACSYVASGSVVLHSCQIHKEQLSRHHSVWRLLLSVLHLLRENATTPFEEWGKRGQQNDKRADFE